MWSLGFVIRAGEPNRHAVEAISGHFGYDVRTETWQDLHDPPAFGSGGNARPQTSRGSRVPRTDEDTSIKSLPCGWRPTMIGQSEHDASVQARMKWGVQPISWLVLLAVLGVTVLCLRSEGRRWWCRFGDLSPWSSGIHTRHTSQHFIDPYSFTHVLHGLLFYAFLRLVAGRLRWDVRLVLAVALECVWEVVENSGPVIGRYRRETIALGYDGDSVLNSLGDIASCMLGFLTAWRLPVRYSIALFLLIDLVLLVVYRDNLLLNLIMLTYPFEAIRSWQMGR
jgi:hypothetical protein